MVISLLRQQMESWLSGRRRTTGNRVSVNSASRVQIPNSPPGSLSHQAPFLMSNMEQNIDIVHSGIYNTHVNDLEVVHVRVHYVRFRKE